MHVSVCFISVSMHVVDVVAHLLSVASHLHDTIDYHILALL
jgi:hypothetical protein